MRTAEERRKKVANEDRAQWRTLKTRAMERRGTVGPAYLLSIPWFQQMLVIWQVLLNSRDLKEKDW